MRRRTAWYPFLSLALAAAGVQAREPVSDEARLVRLVRQDCGACHGMTLKGGLGPALLPEALAGKPPDYLQWVILNGRPGTAMPPWSPLVSAAEAAWIAERLLAGFPGERESGVRPPRGREGPGEVFLDSRFRGNDEVYDSPH